MDMEKNRKTHHESKQDFSNVYFCMQGVPKEHSDETNG